MSWWTKLSRHPLLLLLLLAGVLDICQSAQAQTNPILLPPGDTRPVVDDEAFEKDSKKKTEALAKQGKLTDYTTLARHVPLHREALKLEPVSTNALSSTELAEKLRASTVAVGLRYKDPRSKKWLYEIGATAFAVAPEILSTSLHVMTLDPSMMQEAQAVAVTGKGEVFPITEVVASSDRGDTCLVRVPGLSLPPLPIRPGVKQGEAVWCMSHPDGFTYMFTSGQVARISRERFDKNSAPGLHVEVTAEFCPGSSGGAVTDAAGNVIGQVSSINQYSESGSRDNNRGANGIVSARICTAAEEVLDLTTAGENAPIPLPPPPKKKHHHSKE